MTARYALVGSPIAQSPSPAMHNAGFRTLGLDATYELLEAGVEELPRVEQILATDDFAGFNITTPLKQHMASRVRCSETARRAAAVNTLCKSSQGWEGFLTDVEGVAEPLKARGASGGQALIIGAGGAARAAALALESLGCRVHVAARRIEAARQLLHIVTPTQVGQACSLEEVETLMGASNIVIQATPVGRNGHDLPCALRAMQPDTVVLDMLYLPRRTEFLRQAQQQNATIIEGWEMLLAQGVRAFARWTQKQPPVEPMKNALLGHLDTVS